MRTVSITLLVITFLSGAMLSALFANDARADHSPPDKRLLVAVDSLVISADRRDADVADSVTRLLAGQADSKTIALMSYASMPGEILEFDFDTAELMNGLDEFHSFSTVGVRGGQSDQFRAIAAGFDFLSDFDAAPGSRMLLLTSDGMESASKSTRDRLLSLVRLFTAEGWSIDVAMLPSATAASRAFLASIAAAGGGTAYDTGAIDGLANFASDIYGIQPVPVIQTLLARGGNALAPIDVPPLSDLMTVSVTRGSSDTLIELFDPRGAPVTGARPNVTVVKTAAAILTRVENPEAGKWTARALGDDSDLLISVDIDHSLSIELVDALPVPVGEPVLLAARVKSHGEPANLTGAFIDATVTNANGSAVYRLTDEGAAGDVIEGDGIFSVLVPEFAAQATSAIHMVLRWDNFDATIEDSVILQAEHFPTIRVRDLLPGPIDQGKFADVAEIEIIKADFPFPIVMSELNVQVISPNRIEIPSTVTAVDSLDDGSAWKFIVSAAPQGTGAYRVEAVLGTVYLGRAYETGSGVEGIDIGVIPTPVILPAPEPSFVERVPAWAWAALAIALAIAVPAAVRQLLVRTQPIPYGYLYDDAGRMLIDFGRVRQGFIRRYFARNRVPTSYMRELGLGRGEFVFGEESVKLRSGEARPNMRVNGRPAGQITVLEDEMRLGVGGRLLTFVLQPKAPPALAPDAGD
ncbi:MAG: hypothetical protein IH868_06880 [Chloroflexi bacterium]|nr:hypothetical protein [Chloroflexota bacterium]